MRIVGKVLLGAFPGHIVNIHPSLLPAFPGLEAQRQALEYGVKVAGCTVHLVNEGVDTGPIIRQRSVPVTGADTVESLSRRILAEEHLLYVEALNVLLEGRYRIEGRRVLCDEETA
jgi:phosphoribosylglycinamide formyltransferase 1